MPPAAGPILRILGLIIELFGITILMLSGRGDGADVGARLGLSSNQVWGIVVVGFVVWAVGTSLIYARRLSPRRKKLDEP
jgi:hypothetical protein